MNQMQAAMIRARGFDPNKVFVTRHGPNEFAATLVKVEPGRAQQVACALGKSEDDASAKLVALLVRP